MNKIIRRVFLNVEKEEAWINEMSAKGLHLVRYTFMRYEFEEGLPGEYIYRIQLLDGMAKSNKSMKYIQFMEDMGADCIFTYNRWVIFRKKAEEGNFELYSDMGSRISYYRNLLSLLNWIMLFNIMAIILNVVLGLTIAAGFSSINLYMSAINGILMVCLIPVAGAYYKKVRQLTIDKDLFE